MLQEATADAAPLAVAGAAMGTVLLKKQRKKDGINKDFLDNRKSFR